MDVCGLAWCIGGLSRIGFDPALVSLAISPFVLGAYPAGAVFSVIGILTFRGEVSAGRGLEKLMACTSVFVAVPLAVFGSQHLSNARSLVRLVPVWMPGRLFWVYFVGVALFAAALSLLLKRYVRLSATLLGIMFFLFVLMLHVPNVIALPGNRFAWAVGLRDLSFSGGAFALAAAQTEAWRARSKKLLVALGRFFIAVPAIFFGVEDVLHPTFAPSIPLNRMVPAWVPGRMFWAYLAGVVLVAAGACILVNWKTRAAAIWLGVVILLLVLFVYLPMMVAAPLKIFGMNFVMDTLLYAGTVFALAGAVGKGREAIDG